MRRIIFIGIPVIVAVWLGFWVAGKFSREEPLFPATGTTNAQQPAPSTQQTAPYPVQTDPSQTLGINTSVHLGSFLVGRNGMTLYTYAKDQAGTSTCYAQCAQTWPPYLVSPGVQPKLQTGISSVLTDTITRADGTTQLTYRGLPLYYYAGDSRESDAGGQGLGGVWYVVTP